MAKSTFGPFNMQSGKVYKPLGSLGKTAHREQTYNAPPGHYFVEGSWSVNKFRGVGKNAYIRITRVDRSPFKVILESGEEVTLQLPTSFHVVAHAETGSNRLKAVTAWAEAEISAELQRAS